MKSAQFALKFLLFRLMAVSSVTACSARIVVSLAAGLAFVALTPAQTAFPPTGVQNVLVIPSEYPSPTPGASLGNDPTNCPNPSIPCLIPPQYYVNNTTPPTCPGGCVGPPVHTPQQWSSLLNNDAATYWAQTTYNQTIFNFFVLVDPNTADGWWPVPHGVNSYSRNTNGRAWSQDNNSPPSYAYVPDVATNVLNTACPNGNKSFFAVQNINLCASLGIFQRLLVISNWHSFGAQSYSTGAPALSIPTSTEGVLQMTATWANEGRANDIDVAAMFHELGHQLGENAHYGDCSYYIGLELLLNQATPPPATLDNCLGIGWDIMGLSDSVAQTTAYSKLDLGLIGSTTVDIDWFQTPPFFYKSVSLGPVEDAPVAGGVQPNVIRVSFGDPTWPEFQGYYAECRERINGDGGSSALPVQGVSDVGILIYNVHETSYSAGPPLQSPPIHIDRANAGLPGDQIATATLKPGQTFSSPLAGLFLTFDGYGGDAIGGGSLCLVSISHLPLGTQPRPFKGIISFAGSSRPNGPRQRLDQLSIPSDVGLNYPLPLGSAATVPIPGTGDFARATLPVTPPWVGHDNLVQVKVYNRSLGTANDVHVGVSANQPAVIKAPCMTMSGAGDMGMSEFPKPIPGSGVFRSLPPVSSAIETIHWTPVQDGSVSFDVDAFGSSNRINTASRFAFQFHHISALQDGVSTEFEVAVDPMCREPQTLFIDASFLPPGWQVSVTPPRVTLDPGSTTNVTVLVVPPASAAVGADATIPVLVRHFMANPVPDGSHDSSTVFSPGVHFMTVGALTILSRVTDGSGSISLNVPKASQIDTALLVSGTILPSDLNSPISIEYRSPWGQTITHIVLTGGDGTYTDSVIPAQLFDCSEDDHDNSCVGQWTVQSRWPGDNSNDPVDSNPSSIVMYANTGDRLP